jgi:glycosyltransferase involved in cell wall biosynthesis
MVLDDRGLGMQKQTILLFVANYLPGYKGGGPVRSIANLVAALGDEVHFMIATLDRDLGDKVPYPGILRNQWVRVGYADVMYLRPGWRGLVDGFALLRSVDEKTVDYLNSYFSRRVSMLAVLMCWMQLCRPQKVVLAPRGEFSPGALASKRRRKLLYIAVSHWMKLHGGISWHASSELEAADIRRHYPGSQNIGIAPVIPGSTRTHAPGATDSLATPRRRKKSGGLRVVFVARISPMKNLSGALMMLNGIEGDILFDIYGPAEDRSYWESCQKLIVALPANVRVRFCGPIEHEQVASVFAEHELFLFPTLGESYGHVICESLAAGCPVMISDQTPWRDLEKHGAGWAIPLRETERFRSTLQQVVDADEEWYAALSVGAMRYAKRVTAAPEIIQANRRLFEYAPVFAR